MKTAPKPKLEASQMVTARLPGALFDEVMTLVEARQTSVADLIRTALQAELNRANRVSTLNLDDLARQIHGLLSTGLSSQLELLIGAESDKSEALARLVREAIEREIGRRNGWKPTRDVTLEEVFNQIKQLTEQSQAQAQAARRAQAQLNFMASAMGLATE